MPGFAPGIFLSGVRTFVARGGAMRLSRFRDSRRRGPRFESLTAHQSRNARLLPGVFLSGVRPGSTADTRRVESGRCESGGIGRRTGFRFQRVTPVRVRVPAFAPPCGRSRRAQVIRRAVALRDPAAGFPRYRSARIIAAPRWRPAARSAKLLRSAARASRPASRQLQNRATAGPWWQEQACKSRSNPLATSSVG